MSHKPSHLTLLTAVRSARAEGIVSVYNRIADRLVDRTRERAFEPAISAAALPRSPILNVLSTLPTARLGGLQAQLLQRLDLEARARPVALFYPCESGYRIEVRSGGHQRVLVRPAASPSQLALADPEFQREVAWAANAVGATALHFEGQSALPLGSLLALRRSGYSLIFSVHDFGLFCPRPHLFELPLGAFCHYCRDAERCRNCLAQTWRLDAGHQEERRRLAAELLGEAGAVVFPSAFLHAELRHLFPALPEGRVRILEPMRTADHALHPTGRVPLRHVAYVGSVQPHKGALVLEETIARMSVAGLPPLRWSVHGGGDAALLRRLRRLPGVEIHGYYRTGALPTLLMRREVDLALLLSVVPESYSLSLSECLAAGVPVLAFDHGAIGERLRRQPGAGELVDPESGAAGVATRLTALLRTGVERLAPTGALSAAPAASAMLEIYRAMGLA